MQNRVAPHGNMAGERRPVVSGYPNMTLKFCTAWPEAPYGEGGRKGGGSRGKKEMVNLFCHT